MAAERYLTLAEVKEALEAEADEREFTPEQKIAMDHVDKMIKMDASTAKELRKKLSDIDFVTDMVAVKIVDVMPVHPDDVRVIFAKERLVIDKKQTEQIIKLVEEYL